MKWFAKWSSGIMSNCVSARYCHGIVMRLSYADSCGERALVAEEVRARLETRRAGRATQAPPYLSGGGVFFLPQLHMCLPRLRYESTDRILCTATTPAPRAKGTV